MGPETGSMLFYGGIAGIIVTSISAIIVFIMLSKDKKKLMEELDEEYGKNKQGVSI